MWKIFHRSSLLPRNGKNLTDLQYFQMGKILNRETGKYVYLHKVEKYGAIFFISLRI